MRITILVLMSLILAGCSQTPPIAAKQRIVVDEHYVASVENAAKKASVDVIWINPPTRKADVNH